MTGGCACEGGTCQCGAKRKGVRTLWNLLLAAGVVYLGAMAANAFKQYNYIGRPDAARDTISISAEGKVLAKPDIAMISVGVQTENRAVSAAQKENTAKMNAIIDKIKSFGVAAEDIRTSNYMIYPQYDYPNGRQVERGFMVAQNIDVKVRNLDNIGEILAAVGSLGANQVGGVVFTIDEPEDLRQQARLKALETAKKKAEALASAAGVRLGKVVGFSENDGSGGPFYYAKDAAMGLGGGSGAPAIQPGSQDVIVNVSVLYEILP